MRDAENLAQETFLIAYRDLHQLCKPASFRSWLSSILRQNCYRYLYRQHRTALPLDELEELLEEYDPSIYI